jgi:hypothetical protein
MVGGAYYSARPAVKRICRKKRFSSQRAKHEFTSRKGSFYRAAKATWPVLHMNRCAAIAAGGRKNKKLCNTSCSFVGTAASMKVFGAWPRR